jgi:hypothetical protein
MGCAFSQPHSPRGVGSNQREPQPSGQSSSASASGLSGGLPLAASLNENSGAPADSASLQNTAPGSHHNNRGRLKDWHNGVNRLSTTTELQLLEDLYISSALGRYCVGSLCPVLFLLLVSSAFSGQRRPTATRNQLPFCICLWS